ncbi:hypothetical protein ACFLV7_14505 [Chloroflexota bacterium]
MSRQNRYDRTYGAMISTDGKPTVRSRAVRWRVFSAALVLLILSSGLLGDLRVIRAQGAGQVQIVTGAINPGEFFWYLLPDLQSDQTLYVHMQGTSGNLDPIIGLVDGESDTEALEESYTTAILGALVEGSDPLLAAESAADDLFLVWDDDGGEGLAAAFSFPVPADGDYRLIVSNAISAVGQATFGDYQLLIGLDAPQVLSGEVEPTGDAIAKLDTEASSPSVEVEEFRGSLTEGNTKETLELHEVREGDTLFVFVEATSGDLRPALALLNYADKPVRTANLNGKETSASLEYSVEDRGRGYAIRIEGCCGERGSTGDYSLLVGINAPDVVEGEITPNDQTVIKEPIPVQIGVKMQQIVEVDEQNEFYTAVASLQMEWDDPALAFNPDSCDCVLKNYTEQNFNEFLVDVQGRWPEFTIYNQQGNRWTQNQVAVISQDGHAIYFERFSTNLQVDFDFRKYPFDEENLLIQIDAIYPESVYYFSDLEDYSEISAEHGEDEFVIDDFETSITSTQASTQSTTSRFSFSFGGPRHLDYYLFQIFIPLLLILAVSWVTFFLRDYRHRIEVASANLFVFIAFSFSLADSYPHLGYMTLLDAVMLTTFVISAMVVIYNVWLQRLEMRDHAELADRIDSILDWVYPAALIGTGVALYIIFF